MTPEFNLLDEDWIRVLCSDYTIKEVSLMDALIHAQSYRDLAGELKTQDVAVLRLMLAVLHTVFSRVNVEGVSDPIEDEETAVERWAELWTNKQFPEEAIRNYLESYRDKFYLFHSKYPFYQVPEANIGTEYTSAKLNGELSESNHKLRLFPIRTGKLRNQVTFPEAARWLLYVNGYDDTSAKPKGKNLPSPGAGWLGRLGIVTASGNNLFETLMLNLTLLQDGEKVWGNDVPVWELQEPHKEERKEIPIPDNLAELYTLQSRRLLLKRENDQVTGYYLLGGDFFSRENAFPEQMTIWRKNKDKKNGPVIFQPKRHDASRLIWRDFASLALQQEDHHIPGIVSWLTQLKEMEILPADNMIRLQITSVQYGDKDFFVTDEFGDSLSFVAELLTKKGKVWQTLVLDEIERCEKRANYVADLARDLVRAAGGDDAEEISQGRQAKENFFYQLDIPFRTWLESLQPWQTDEIRYEKQEEWNLLADKVARKLGREMAEATGQKAFVGRKDAESGKYYNAAEALNWFNYHITKIQKEG